MKDTTRRSVLKSAGAAGALGAFAAITAKTCTAEAAADPVVELYAEWERETARAEALQAQYDEMEAALPSELKSAPWVDFWQGANVNSTAKSEETIDQFPGRLRLCAPIHDETLRNAIEDYCARKKAELREKTARWQEGRSELWAMGDRIDKHTDDADTILERIRETPAQSMQGVVCKFAVAFSFMSKDPREIPKAKQELDDELLLAAFEEATRLGGAS